ncbi:MAG: DinB family protein [Gemmatimonadota bacterium]
MIHDPGVLERLRSRIESLTPTSPRRWGKMSVNQMLWHCNESLEMALGRLAPRPPRIPPLPRSWLKFLVLRMPWPRGAPTYAAFISPTVHDFEKERARTRMLLQEASDRDLNGPWPPNPVWGPTSGREWSQLMARHLDHHLRQFSA